MSSPTPPRSKGRGRGRKELTPNERVTQWVNQREAKRLSKERWSNQNSSGSSVTEDGDNQNVTQAAVRKESLEHDSSSTKMKRQVVQVYVPPSLRGKKISDHNTDTGPQPTINRDKLSTCNVQDRTEEYNANSAAQDKDINKPCPKNKLADTEDVSKSRGRGRGRRKPEMEIYVPRALRSTKQEGANVASSSVACDRQKVSASTRERDKEGQNETSREIVDSKVLEYSSESSSRQSSESRSMNSSLTEVIVSNSSFSTTDSWSGDMSDVPCNIAYSSGDTGTVQKEQHEKENDSALKVNVANDEVGSSECVNDSFTFEFYDPAVIAFLPSPPVVPQPGNKDNTGYFKGDYHSSPSAHSQNTAVLSDSTCALSPNTCNSQQFLGAVDSEYISSSPAIDSTVLNSQKLQSYPEKSNETKELKEEHFDNPFSTTDVKENYESVAECQFGEPEKEGIQHTTTTTRESSMASEKDTSIHLNESVDVVCVSTSLPPSITEERKTNEILNPQEQPTLTSKQQVDSPSNQQYLTSESFEQTNQQDLINSKNKVELKQSEEPLNEMEEGDGGDIDSWDALFDDNGDCLDDTLMEELTEYVGKVEIDKPKINYLKYEPKEPELDFQAFNHIIEIYDFSPELATCDIMTAFKDFASRGFDVKWVDDTHALGIFSSAVAAKDALRMMHPLLRVRPMSEASKKGQSKARHCQEFLQPYKARPETTSMAARRLVAGALGMAPRVSKEMREQERKKLKEAKEKRRQERQQKVDIWDGSFGKCAMDEDSTTGSR